jgi:Ala-tRNA(Pro) deacylase
MTMGIAISVQQYLNDNDVKFDSIEHRPTSSSSESAIASFIPGENLAKAVVLRNQEGYLLTVLPSSRMTDLDKVGSLLDHPVALAPENEINALFPDCEDGAIPPIGAAYGMHTIVDERLDAMNDVYFEAGDHRTLVHMSGRQFFKLMRKSDHASICAKSKPGFNAMNFGYYGA